MKLNGKQLKRIKELEPYLKSSRPISGNEIIDLYNDVFQTDSKRKVGYTGCGSCLRKYLMKLIDEKNKYMETMRMARKRKKEEENSHIVN